MMPVVFTDFFLSLFSQSKTIELGLWIVRYISTFFLFVLGFRAPGLPGKTFHELQRRIQEMDEEEEVRLSSKLLNNIAKGNLTNDW